MERTLLSLLVLAPLTSTAGRLAAFCQNGVIRLVDRHETTFQSGNLHSVFFHIDAVFADRALQSVYSSQSASQRRPRTPQTRSAAGKLLDGPGRLQCHPADAPHITAELNRLMLHTISILCPKPYHIHYFGTDLIPAARDAPTTTSFAFPLAHLLQMKASSRPLICFRPFHRRLLSLLLSAPAAIASHACQPDCPRTPTQLILPCGAGEDTGPACSAHLGTAAIEPQQPRAAPLSLLKSTGESVSTPNLTDRHPSWTGQTQLTCFGARRLLLSAHCTDGASSQPAEQKLPTTITVLGTQPASKPRLSLLIRQSPPARGLAARAGSTTLGGPPAGRAHPTHKADHSQFTVRSPLPPLAAAEAPDVLKAPPLLTTPSLHTTRPSPCPTPLSSIHRPPNKSQMLSLPVRVLLIRVLLH
ncbi:hypothetical protein BLNAU_24051 [Blattamonas nauphoetae]|uniref:Uncharacterized protein n=1 Tax=Blattamonas nauphoetae TaxID=2049346 RepID=A0ABQ9WQJ1_9EUKA|nr:hypothetical protein BLNAU_24051 [Blattamonas nauphoetae]